LIARSTILCLGLSQLICWGISFYLICAFGELIAADLGWSRDIVYGGFSAALVVMGLASPLAGRLIDRHGGRVVMSAGSVLIALACAALAFSFDIWTYYAAWLLLGLAMRMTLYDAAFATLARLGGSAARQPMSQITLLGGLAATAFWPLGHGLAEHFGWRAAVLVYAGFALATLPLHLAIPKGRHGERPAESAMREHPPLAVAPRDRFAAGALYALIVTLVYFLNSGMSAHMIAILSGLGIAASAAVWIATLRGIGQSLARLCQVLFGGRLSPLSLNLLAVLLLPFCFAAGLLSGQFVAAALAFAFFYGAGNGLLSITRGTLPLTLFDHRTYGAFAGKLLAPSFILSAGAPVAYASLIENFGFEAALYLSIAVACVMLAAAAALAIMFRSRECEQADRNAHRAPAR
jgi:predicted MFS family arabinose efflux permease